MKSMTATEARKNWFRLLDEVARGEVVVLERNGKRIVMRSEDEPEPASIPDYSELLRVPDVENADLWGWEWVGPEHELIPKTLDRDGEQES